MESEYDLVVNGRLFRVKHTSARRRMAINLRDLPPFCTATVPYRTSVNTVTEFIKNQEPWLKKHITADNIPCVLRGGNIIRYMGNTYDVEYVPGSRFGIRFRGDKAIITRPNGADANDVARYVRRFYSNELKKILTVKLPYFEGVTGLKCKGCKIKLLSAKWGSCNTRTAEITFNSYLVAKEEAYIDYVIVHELAHIKYPDHGANFKAFLMAHCPEASKKYVKRPPR